jgi:hypothetical protein
MFAKILTQADCWGSFFALMFASLLAHEGDIVLLHQVRDVVRAPLLTQVHQVLL